MINKYVLALAYLHIQFVKFLLSPRFINFQNIENLLFKFHMLTRISPLLSICIQPGSHLAVGDP